WALGAWPPPYLPRYAGEVGGVRTMPIAIAARSAILDASRSRSRAMAQTIGKTTWPPLPYEDWRETAATLHLWLQIVGKIRLTLTPWLNHSWHVTLHTTARGLSTPPMWHQGTSFQIEFDFIDHRL